jgi:hypothetical protein
MRVVSSAAAIAALCAAASQSLATVVDLTTAGASGSLNGALFRELSLSPTGTGNIQSFVRTQHSGTQLGYNTSGRPVAYDEGTDPNFTRDRTLASVPIVTYQGNNYYEFRLDVNQVNSSPLISLDSVEIRTRSLASVTGAWGAAQGTVRYTFGFSQDHSSNTLTSGSAADYVLLNYSLNAGSGQGDMAMLIPVSNFAGALGTDYVYLYSHFGDHNATNDGFEEWFTFESTVVPLPPGGLAGGALVGGLMLVRLRRRSA